MSISRKPQTDEYQNDLSDDEVENGIEDGDNQMSYDSTSKKKS